MRVKRLVVFGCSFTYGYGLPDCFESGNPSSTPSKLAWPNFLGKELDLEVVNLSKTGSSNLQILNTILNTEIRKDDLVIVQWSFSQRSMLFGEPYNSEIGSWVDTETSKYFYLAHDDFDLLNQTFLHIHHADLHLKSVCNSFIHFMISYDKSYRKYIGNKPEWFNVKCNPITFYIDPDDKGLDNSHPGQENQKLVANYILNYVKKEKYDTKN